MSASDTHTSSRVLISKGHLYLWLSKVIAGFLTQTVLKLDLSFFRVCMRRPVKGSCRVWAVIITVLPFRMTWGCVCRTLLGQLQSLTTTKQSAWGNRQIGQRKKLTQPCLSSLNKTKGGGRWILDLTFHSFLDSACMSSCICSCIQTLSFYLNTNNDSFIVSS